MTDQEWAVKHPDGQITVRVDGHPFYAREEAAAEAAGCDWATQNGGCDDCDAETGQHIVVIRDVTRSPWRSE